MVGIFVFATCNWLNLFNFDARKHWRTLTYLWLACLLLLIKRTHGEVPVIESQMLVGGEQSMNTSAFESPVWALGTTRRCVRGVIGAAAITAILLVPGLNESWLFVLAIVGAYESLTAILDADLVYGVFYLMIEAVQGTSRMELAGDNIKISPLITPRYGQQEYQPAG